MLAIIVGLVTGTSVMLLFGYPLTQALVTGSCAMIGMYIGQFLSKRRAEKKAQKKELKSIISTAPTSIYSTKSIVLRLFPVVVPQV